MPTAGKKPKMPKTPQSGKVSARKPASADSSAAVDRFMEALDHPCKAEIEALREIIREADATIAEGVKWNAPSFRTSGYFATTHLRARDGVALILHLGARVRTGSAPTIDDPAGMLKWLGKDRAMVTFSGMKDIRARQAAFERILRQWIRHVEA